jgi:transposase
MTVASAPWRNPVEIAELLAVSPDKVRGWLERGELRGSNVASSRSGKRPRWRVSPEALQQFLQSREAVPVVKQIRRRKRQADCIEFF